MKVERYMMIKEEKEDEEGKNTKKWTQEKKIKKRCNEFKAKSILFCDKFKSHIDYVHLYIFKFELRDVWCDEEKKENKWLGEIDNKQATDK